MPRTLITVPIKEAAAAKTRLAGDLTPAARVRLVDLLFRRTLDVVQPLTGAAVDLAVITGCPRAASVAEARGLRVIAEPPGAGLNGAVCEGARRAEAEGYDRLCVIPADLAAPDPADLLRLLASRAAVTVVPSTDLGTNALLIAPPGAITFHYGPQSAQKHLRAAEARGLTTCLMPLDSLSFDIDTSACLARAIQTAPEIAEICA
ncbi:MAG: 2-phospho-L-lactate guanylyltransferase [Pseudomonadota bacterium]